MKNRTIISYLENEASQFLHNIKVKVKEVVKEIKYFEKVIPDNKFNKNQRKRTTTKKMYAKYKGEYFHAKPFGDQIMIWRTTPIDNGDCIYCPDGAKIFRKYVKYPELTKVFYGDFLIDWKNILCDAMLSDNKKNVTLSFTCSNEDILNEHKPKWNEDTKCWNLVVPIQECDNYFLQTVEIYPRKNKEKIKRMSMEYWIEMFEKMKEG